MMPTIPAPRTSGYTRTTHIPLYWCTYGRPGAPRVLLLHGGPGAHHDYLLPQMLRMAGPVGAEQRELLFYDQRGGGRSRVEDRAREGDLGWESHVLDLEQVIAELGAAPLVLLGYSWGGMLALLYAREAIQGRVAPLPEKLLLIDPAPITRAFRSEFESEFARRQSGPAIQAMRAELAASRLRESDPEAYRQRSFELSVAGYFADPTAARDLTPFRVTGRVQQAVWDSLDDYDLLADRRLSVLDRPALVVHGRQDPIPLASSDACARALGARLVVLDRCGHVPYVEQPDALFQAIDQFLTAH